MKRSSTEFAYGPASGGPLMQSVTYVGAYVRPRVVESWGGAISVLIPASRPALRLSNPCERMPRIGGKI
jgi:hypothetical protein